MAETAIGALAVRIGGDASGLISELAKSKTALGKFGASAANAAKSAAQITGAVAAAGTAIFAFTKRQAEMLDELAKTSQKVGVSVESLSALKHAASLSGASFETLTNGLRFLNKNMADMQAGTGEARQAFQGMGVSVVDSNGKLKGTEEMLLELADRFASMQDGAGKTALAMRIFGKSGAELIPFLNEGRAGIEQLRKEAERLGIVFSTQAAKDAELFNDNVERLTRVVDGLAVQLAGPLVEALGKAAGAMLEAHREGEGFFGALARGWRMLVTGDDAHKLNVQISETTDKLSRLQDIGDQLRRFPQTPMNVQRIEANNRAIQQTREELEKLIKLKPIISPEAPPKPKGAAAPALEETGRAAAIEREKEFIGKALQEGLEEEQRIQQEANDAVVFWANKRLEDEKALQAALQAAKIEGHEWEQEQAIQQGEELLAIDAAIAEQKQAQREREKRANADFWNNLSGLMNTGSKKVFEIGKAFSLGQAAVKGASAVMSAWEAGMSVGGPWAPLVAAAYAAAAGLNALNLMNNIRSQQFGGGGGAPIAPTQGSSGISPVGAGGGATSQQQRGPDTILNIRGDDIFTGRTVAKLAERLNEFTRDGGRILVSQS